MNEKRIKSYPAVKVGRLDNKNGGSLSRVAIFIEAYIYTSSVDECYNAIVDSLVEAGYILWGSTSNVYVIYDGDNSYHVTLLKDKTQITVVNNGNPLPKNMDKERVFTYGQSSGKGEGLGGWQIKNIVKHYGGIVDLDSNDGSETDGFTVAYVMTFPVVNFQNINLDEI